jgi:hypothetical protein
VSASAVQLQHRRGSSAQVQTFTGAQGEVAIDTTANRLVVQDGTTPGGWPAAKVSEMGRFAATLNNVNFNSANSDNQIAIPLPPGFSTFLVAGAFISNASHSLTTATCGLFTAAGAGGVAIVSSATAITVSSTAANTNNNAQSLTINNANTQSYNAGILFFRVQTAEGAAATGTVTLHITPLF